jgi:hypothetical protein
MGRIRSTLSTLLLATEAPLQDSRGDVDRIRYLLFCNFRVAGLIECFYSFPFWNIQSKEKTMKQCTVCKHEYKRPDDSQADGHKDEEFARSIAAVSAYIPQPRTWSLTDEQIASIKRMVNYLQYELDWSYEWALFTDPTLISSDIELLSEWLQDSGVNDL